MGRDDHGWGVFARLRGEADGEMAWFILCGCQDNQLSWGGHLLERERNAAIPTKNGYRRFLCS